MVHVAHALDAMGCYEITVCDTIGTGTAGKTRAVIEAVAEAHPDRDAWPGISTTPTARRSTNIYAALECGIATFDSSVSGLGGCPYAKGATGNVATEDVLYLLDGLGIETGIDMDKLIAAGDYICGVLGRGRRCRAPRARSAPRRHDPAGQRARRA